MTIPTEIELAEYAELVEATNVYEYGLKLLDVLPANKETVRKILADSHEARKEKYRALRSHSVDKWLQTQPAFLMAEIRAFKMKRAAPVFEKRPWIERTTERLMDLIERYEATPEDDRLRMYRGYSIKRVFGPPAGAQWDLAVIGALREYLYSENEAEIVRCRRQLPVLLNDARGALKILADGLERQFAKYDEFVDLNSLRRRVEMLRTVLHDSALQDVEECYPLKRHDKTAKERLFVYRMSVFHKRFFRAPRPEAISFLLELEGIENQLDLRNVEKLCQQFTEQQNRLRQLKASNSKINARSRV